MDRHQGWIWLAFRLLAFIDLGFGYFIIEGPQNLTVLVGSVARFNCTVSEGWPVLIWLFDGNPILTVLNNGTPIITQKKYNQEGFKNGSEFTSELKIFDVQLNDSGEIKCSIQNEVNNNYAFLSVQVNGSLTIKDSNLTVRKNQTTEIVCEALGWAPAPHIFWMVNNISLDNSMYIANQSQGSNGLYNEESILTLTPMTSGIVTCLAVIDALSKPQYAAVTLIVYEPPSKSNYRKEMRKVSEKKATDRNLETMRHSGQANYAYSPEETEYSEQVAGVPSFFPDNSSLYGPKQDLEVTPTSQISSQFSSSSQSLQRSSPALPFNHFNQRSQEGTAQQSRRIPKVRFRTVSSKTRKSRARQLHSLKLHPHIQQSNGKHRYTRKVYPQWRQSGDWHKYKRRLMHQPEPTKAKDFQLQHSRGQHMYPRVQLKKSTP
ncbi:immunoglobulin superfamily member 5 isoform X2 [Rhineura floridana]|uniref:immunoglobulin superfamily member 5 isoform X2 n=1 Tax=Rhineura floridana TaxID=261503 RepID=UPI002AC80845|nr:immunoglobulin superfamily member 5 isoform X2 [Rhineura floridana]